MSQEIDNTLYIAAPTAERLDLFIQPISMPRPGLGGSLTREFHNMPDGSKSVEMFFVTRNGPPLEAYKMLWQRKEIFPDIRMRASYTDEADAWQIQYRWDFEKMVPVVAADGLYPGFIELDSGQSLNDRVRRELEEVYSKLCDEFGKNCEPCKSLQRVMEKYPFDADRALPL